MASVPPQAGGGDGPEQIPGDAQKAVDEAIESAMKSVSDLQSEVGQASAQAKAFEMPTLNKEPLRTTPRGIDVLAEVDLDVSIELGRTQMLVEDVLRLEEGAVIELDKLAGDPVDVYVNGRHVARGEVLVLNDNFCVRVSEIVDGVKPHPTPPTES
jgi:flagellar motor switch protein FliN/FliY